MNIQTVQNPESNITPVERDGKIIQKVLQAVGAKICFRRKIFQKLNYFSTGKIWLWIEKRRWCFIWPFAKMAQKTNFF